MLVRRIAAVALVAVIPVTVMAAASTGGGLRVDAAGPDPKVTICHWTGSGRWVVETPNSNAVVSGHGHHPNDIIPAVTLVQGNREIHFGGSNLGVVLPDGTTGQQILAAGCRAPTVSGPTSTVPSSTAQPASTSGVPPTLAPSTLAPPTTVVPPTLAPSTTVVPSTLVPPTLAPSTTVAPPTLAPSTIVVPPTLAPSTTVVPPTLAPSTLAPSTTVVPPTLVPPTLAPSTTVAPTTSLTPARCGAGAVEIDGTCYSLPPLVLEPAIVDPTRPVGLLVPLAECVDRREDGVDVAWFGYELLGESTVRVERGSDNDLSPNGLPPTLFGPGVHARVVSVEARGQVAAWTLAGTTAVAGPETPRCDELGQLPDALPTSSLPVTTTSEGANPTSTTTPPADAAAVSSTTTTTVAPTSTGDSTPDEESGCGVGRRLLDGECVTVEPVELILVDNFLECDGHGVARFVGTNPNDFDLGETELTSTLTPQRLGGEQPTFVEADPVVDADGRLVAGVFAVRYVTAVTWTVAHDGLEVSVSAGVSGARTNPDCPLALAESSGWHGSREDPGDMPVTGGGSDTATLAVAFWLVGAGVGLIALSRRRPRRRVEGSAT